MGSIREHLSAQVERTLAGAAGWSFGHPARALAAVALLTALALWQARTLSVNSDMSELLPESFPSVQALHLLEKRFGSIGYVVVAVWGGDGETLKKMADDLAPVLEALPDVRYVDYTRPTAFLEEHALYFLETADLIEIRDRLVAREEYEKRKANPLFIDFEQAAPPPVDLSGMKSRYDVRGDRQWVQAQLGARYYFDPDKPLVMLMAKPANPNLDLAYARVLVDHVKQAVATFNPQRYDARFEVGFTGRYTKRIDQQALIQKDLAIASMVALVLVLGYIALHFRRLLATALIMVPLLVGLCWSFGLASVTFGALNILTAFIASVLTGLGIDNGIHLLSRFQSEHALGSSDDAAVRATFGNTGRGVVVAALTTVAGFAALAPSEFRAFREFGTIAAGGIVLLIGAYFLTLPALLALALRHGWRPRSEAHQEPGRLMGVILGHPGGVLTGCILAVALCCTALPRLRFDFDFRALEKSDLPSFRLDRETNRLLGYSQTPIVVLTPNSADERTIAEQLRARRIEFGSDSTLDFIAASVDLVPEHQETKRVLIERIGAIVGKVRPSWVAPELRHYLDIAKHMTTAKPFRFDDLPSEVRRQFQGVDAEAGEGFIMAFPGIDLSDGVATARLAREIRGASALAGRASIVAGEAMVLADILEMVVREAPKVIATAAIAIFLVTLLLLGRLRDTVVSLAPALVSVAATLALMPVVGLRHLGK